MTDKNPNDPLAVQGMAPQVRPMPTDAPKQGYTKFKFEGREAYQCAGCRFSTTNVDMMTAHISQVHPYWEESQVVSPPNLKKGGVVRAVIGDNGEITGYEEVKDA